MISLKFNAIRFQSNNILKEAVFELKLSLLKKAAK